MFKQHQQGFKPKANRLLRTNAKIANTTNKLFRENAHKLPKEKPLRQKTPKSKNKKPTIQQSTQTVKITKRINNLLYNKKIIENIDTH